MQEWRDLARSVQTTSFARLTGYLLGPCTAWPEAVASVIVVAGRKTSGRNVSTDFGRIEMKTQIGRLMAAVVKSEHRCIDSHSVRHSIVSRRPSPSGLRIWFFCCAAVSFALSSAIWAQQSERLSTGTVSRPEPVWTPSSGAPARLLTALEGGTMTNSSSERGQETSIWSFSARRTPRCGCGRTPSWVA